MQEPCLSLLLSPEGAFLSSNLGLTLRQAYILSPHLPPGDVKARVTTRLLLQTPHQEAPDNQDRGRT